MTYQDIRVNGVTIQKGNRNCPERYNIIKSFCDQFKKPFTVLDIGANMCYFGLRLIEDFECSVVAFEFDHFELRKNNIEANATTKLMLLQRKISLPDLAVLSSCCRFDLVLALSVLHHFPGDKYKWIDGMKKLGSNLIIEFALQDSKRVKEFELPKGDVLGYGDSHLKKDFKRPIILFKN